MRGSTRRRRSRSRSGDLLAGLCCVLLVAVLVAGVSIPSESFSSGDLPRNSNVDVTGDVNAAHTLDTAQAVSINDTSHLVNVTNRLGRSVTVTVTIRSDSTHLGDLVVDGVDHGNETSFDLGRDGTENVLIRIPDDSSLTDETVYFHVNAAAPGLTVNAPDRGAPVNA